MMHVMIIIAVESLILSLFIISNNDINNEEEK
jgi:hypothetical protein